MAPLAGGPLPARLLLASCCVAGMKNPLDGVKQPTKASESSVGMFQYFLKVWRVGRGP